MASQILLAKNIDVSKINFGAAKLLNGGARIVPVSYDGKQFIFQTARMTCSYGMSKWGEGAAAKYSVDGSFKNKETNKSLDHFYDFLMNLDKFMVEKGVENSVEWFKKKHTNTEVVAALYSHTVRFPKDKETGEITDKYPPTFKMNLPVKDGKATCQVYDCKQNQLDVMNGMNLKGATVSAIIKCTGVWLAGGNYGLTFRVEQLRVEAAQDSLQSFAFQDEDDNVCAPEDGDDDEDCDVGDHDVGASSAKKSAGTHIDTSDDEEDVPEVAAPPPAPPVEEEEDAIDPAPAKKAPAKKATAKK